MLKSIRNTCAYYFCLIWLLSNIISATHGRSPDRMTRIRCPTPELIPNGSYRVRKNNLIMRIQCRQGFELQGTRLVECIRGKWHGEKPVCAKRGCEIQVPNPEHGHIVMENDFRMILFCLDNYKLAGNRFVYCNGTHWDREIGNCREPSYFVEHECDFETDDYCGWVSEETIGTEWKRVMAANVYTSYHTGPRHDHTTMTASGGHYMLMETVTPEAEPALFISPIYERDLSLKTACCFQFYYFMYGSGVGILKVYVRPISITVKNVLLQDKYLRFQKSGNQNNLWNEAHFSIDELDDDFQIIFVASAGKTHLSDIAIDDVKLMTGDDCRALDRPNEDDDNSESDEVTDEMLIDTQSCRGRCLEGSGAGFVRRFGQLYGRCNCHAECEEDESCCPDFRSTCLSVIFEQTTQIYADSTPFIAIEPTINESLLPIEKDILTTTLIPSTSLTTTPTTTSTSTTTRKTTTTKKKTTTPSTTTTTTTTTTPKPTTPKTTTTRKTTTTTTTTPKPTKKTIFFNKTTLKTTTSIKTTTKVTTTTKAPTTTSSTTLKAIITTTSNLKPRTSMTIPFIKPKEGTQSKSGKQEIISWSIDNSSKEYKSHANRILLTALILLLITVLIGTAYYRYKEDVRAWFRTENGIFGDVETTSIRAKFRAKTNQLSTSNAFVGIKSRLGLSTNRGNDDMNCLLDADNDFDNDASLSVDNPVAAMTVEKGRKNSLSTNL